MGLLVTGGWGCAARPFRRGGAGRVPPRGAPLHAASPASKSRTSKNLPKIWRDPHHPARHMTHVLLTHCTLGGWRLRHTGQVLARHLGHVLLAPCGCTLQDRARLRVATCNPRLRSHPAAPTLTGPLPRHGREVGRRQAGAGIFNPAHAGAVAEGCSRGGQAAGQANLAATDMAAVRRLQAEQEARGGPVVGSRKRTAVQRLNL